MSWYNVGRQDDEWRFYVESNVDTGDLLIVTDTTFFADFEWKDTGYGIVSYSDDFKQTIPVSVQYKSKDVKSGEVQNLVITAPLRSMGEERPTNLYYKLYIVQNGINKEIVISLTMAWKE